MIWHCVVSLCFDILLIVFQHNSFHLDRDFVCVFLLLDNNSFEWKFCSRNSLIISYRTHLFLIVNIIRLFYLHTFLLIDDKYLRFTSQSNERKETQNETRDRVKNANRSKIGRLTSVLCFFLSRELLAKHRMRFSRLSCYSD